MISVQHLVKSFGKLTVLKDVNAEIRKGEVISIIGPSGCGKSTFLRCLNLLEVPDSGRIEIDGKNILEPEADIAAVRQKMNMVFQSFNLFAHLTAIENLTLAPMRLKGQTPAEAEARAMELLRVVGLAEKAHAFPDELSGGQKQRVAIARCLAMEPQIILLDEPTSALDPTMVREVQAVIRRLAREGMTMAIVTHEMDFARDVSNRVFYMDEGVIYEDAPPEILFGNPQREKTRAFINRIRSWSRLVESADYDLYAIHAAVAAFCEKQGLSKKLSDNLLLLIEEMLILYRPTLATQSIDLQVTNSEKTGDLRLAFAASSELANPLDAAEEDDLGAMLVRNMTRDISYVSSAEGSRLELLLAAAKPSS